MLLTLLAILESEDDRRMLSALYEENHDRMEQTALRILNDPRDAEDAVQNAFVKVIGSFEKIFEIPREEIPFWLVCIVKNEALSILRKNARSEAVDRYQRQRLCRDGARRGSKMGQKGRHWLRLDSRHCGG